MIGPNFVLRYKKKLVTEWKVKISQSFTNHKSQKQPQYYQKYDNSNGKEISNLVLSKNTKYV